MFATNPSSRRRNVAISLAVAPLFLAACGGSSSGATADSWCDFADESDIVDELFESFGADSAELEEGIGQVESFVKRLPNEAPDEIKDDAKKLADGTQMLVDAIKEANFNLLDADLGFLEDATLDAELEEASENIDAYTERECGRSFSGDDAPDDDADAPDIDSDTDSADGDSSDADSGDFNPADGTIREQLVAQFESIGLNNDEASCIADKLDFNDPAVLSGDIGAMLDVFDECGIGLDRLAELGG